MTDPVSGEATTWADLPSRGDVRWLRIAQSFDAYLREFSSLVPLARALTGSAAAEDIAQDAMIAAHRRWAEIGQFDNPAGRQAQAISRHYIYDLQVADIAHTLGCSESSVKAHLVRGRAALSARLGLAEGNPS